MSKFFSFIFIIVISFFILQPVSAQDSDFKTKCPDCAECDQCGYCPLNYPPPGTWKNCAVCLYPNLFPEGTDPDPNTYKTLKVDVTSQNAPTPQPGRMYTMVGCVKTDLSLKGFSDDGAAASVVQLFLNYLFRMIGGIAFLYLMYGSYLVLTSRGDPERLNHGRQTLYASAVGLIFSLLSIFIVRLIATGILRIPGFG